MADPRTELDAKLEAEIQSALGDMSIDDLLAEEERPGGRPTSKRGNERQLRSGVVVSIHSGDVMVEFGPRMQGVCPADQFDEPPTPGESYDFFIDRFDKTDEIYMVSRKGAVAKAAWDSLDVGQTVEARCTGTNKGGLEMEVAQHRAFMPAGQVDIRHVDDLEQFIEQKLTCEVIEVDRGSNRIILSRRAHLEAQRAADRESTLANLEVGQEVGGTVTSLQPYGAFVDIGGVDGLVHISDLSYKHISKPDEVVSVGDTVNVRVLKIDDSENPPKIGLGLKQTMADPFQASAGDIDEGATVTGRVTNIADFGAFVELSPGVEGLIHISELSHERVNRVDQVVKKDEIVTVKVLSVDRQKQRISLSLKAMREKELAEQPRQVDSSMEKLKAKFGDFGDLKGGLG